MVEYLIFSKHIKLSHKLLVTLFTLASSIGLLTLAVVPSLRELGFNDCGVLCINFLDTLWPV